ncbi:hypothetical protein AAC387_Pa03g2071 [Persea americana]
MGIYRHWLGDPLSIGLFREAYKIPANVEVRPDGPDDGISYRDDWMPFWPVSVVEGGIWFPLHPLLRDCLREWELSPCQLLPNGYKIIMGVVRLNEILEINLGVPDIKEAYDLCKSAEGNTFSAKKGIRQKKPVEGEQRLAREGAKVPRPSLPSRVLASGLKPHYKSFITPRRVTGIDAVLLGENISSNTVQTEVAISKTVTVAIPSGIPAESGEQSPGREPAGTVKAETGRKRQRQKFVVSSASRSSSSLEEYEVEMLRSRGQRFVAEDLSAAAFGDIGGETSDPFRGANVAPTTTPVAAAEVLAPAAEMGPGAVYGAQSGPPAAVEVGADPLAIVVDESPSDSGREGPAEVVKARRPEKRARVDLPPAPEPPMSVGESATPSEFVPWRPDIEGVLGRQLAESDRAVNPEVVAALGRACALPQDMARWARMDNESLLLSSMRSLVAVCHLILHIPLLFCCVLSADTLFLLQFLQKCQTGIGRLDAAEARAAVWAAEKEELLKSLAAKDTTLAEEASRNADLFAELDAARALAEHLKEKAKEEADQNAHLSYELDEVRLALSR